jgi:hypothetical protein
MIPKFYTLYNPKDSHQWTDPQRVIFIVFEGDLVKITYQMGDSVVHHSMINVKGSKDKPMELHHSQSKDFTLNAARTVWDWLVDELGWVRPVNGA